MSPHPRHSHTARRALLGAAALATVLSLPSHASAQHTGGAQPLSTRPPAEAAQWDFLVGQWDLTIEPVLSGLASLVHRPQKMKGSWKAWRALDGWGVEDEMRIVDDAGNPRSLTRFVRLYDGATKGWKIVAIDAYRGAVTQSTARLGADGMESTSGTLTNAEGQTYMTRSRITHVTGTSFAWVQERSEDGGRKWEPVLRIDATRVAATAPR